MCKLSLSFLMVIVMIFISNCGVGGGSNSGSIVDSGESSSTTSGTDTGTTTTTGGTTILAGTALPAANSLPKTTSLSADTEVAEAGTTLIFTAIISNEGTVATGDFKVRLYYQRAMEFASGGHTASSDIECGIASVNIPAGGTATVVFRTTMPYQASDGVFISNLNWGFPESGYDSGRICFFTKIFYSRGPTPNYSSNAIVSLPGGGTG